MPTALSRYLEEAMTTGQASFSALFAGKRFHFHVRLDEDQDETQTLLMTIWHTNPKSPQGPYGFAWPPGDGQSMVRVYEKDLADQDKKTLHEELSGLEEINGRIHCHVSLRAHVAEEGGRLLAKGAKILEGNVREADRSNSRLPQKPPCKSQLEIPEAGQGGDGGADGEGLDNFKSPGDWL